jgi:hypothetical protein
MDAGHCFSVASHWTSAIRKLSRNGLRGDLLEEPLDNVEGIGVKT